MNIFSKVSLLGTSNLPKPWRPAFLSLELATQTGWQSITYGNGIYLARGKRTAKYLSTSTDGINWGTPYEVDPSNPDSSFRYTGSIAYGNGVFVAVGSYSGTFVSTDAINWNLVSVGASLRENTNLIFDGAKFVVIDSQLGSVWTSVDGTNWTETEPTTGATNYAKSLAFNGSIYVINCANGYIYTSTDLRNWTSARPTGIPDAFLWEMIMGYDGSRFFGTFNGQISYSIDGISWTTPVTDSNLGNHNWTASTTNDIKTVLISSDGCISTKRI